MPCLGISATIVIIWCFYCTTIVTFKKKSGYCPTMATLTVKMTQREIDDIRDKVEEGNAMNVSDFVRQAIREKMAKLEV